MAGTLHIWNMALGWVGARTIASEDENTQEAVQCRLFWDSARRQVLRDYPWPFARRRAWLARLPLPEGWEGEFAHAFALPADCLKVLGLRGTGAASGASSVAGSVSSSAASTGAGEAASAVSLPWTLAYHPEAARQTLLCNAGAALLTYSADVRDVGLYDDLFVHVLARRLAALVAAPLLRGNAAKVREMEELYRAALPSAREASASEVPAVLCRDSWLEARA